MPSGGQGGGRCRAGILGEFYTRGKLAGRASPGQPLDLDHLPAPHKHAGDAPRQRGDHLVVDRSGQLGHFLGADRCLALRAEQHDLIVLRHAGGALTTAASSRVACDVKEAIIYGTAGKIEIHDPWYKPTRMTIHRAGHEPEVVEMPLGGFTGYEYEAQAVMDCIREGRTECAVMPLDDTLAVMETLDRIRQQWRLSLVD